MGRAQLPASLEGDACEGQLPDGLGGEQGGVVADLLVGRAEGVLVAVAEAVGHDEVGMLAAERAVVGQHDPGADADAARVEGVDGAVERVVRSPSNERSGDGDSWPPQGASRKGR